MPEDQVNEIISIFMKIKGEYIDYTHPIVKLFRKPRAIIDFDDVPVYKIYNIRSIFKDNDNPDMEDVTEVVHLLTGLSYKKLVKKRTLEICKLYKFVVDGLDYLGTIEPLLIRHIEAAERKAGIDKLNPFGNLTSIKMVADFYNEKWEESEKRPYKECFVVWYYQKQKADFDKAYFDIKNKT